MSHSLFQLESLEKRSLLSAGSLSAPSALKATPTSSTAVKLIWVDNASAELGFKIERSVDGTNYTQVNVIGPNETAYTNGKLKSDVLYYFRVRAVGPNSNSGYTNVAKATPKSPGGVSTPPTQEPAAPTNLKATPTSSTAIKLTWTDNASNEVAYLVERSTDGIQYTQINSIGPNQTAYSNGKLKTGTLYYYRIRAAGEAGNSDYSKVAKGTVKPAPVVTPPPAPTAPTNLKATPTSSTAIKLTWDDNANNETGFAIERSIDGINYKQVNTVDANVLSYSNGKLVTGTKYYYRIRALGSSGASDYSNIAKATPKAPVVVTPPPGPLPVPTNLTAVATSATGVHLVWTDNATSETGYKIESSIDGTTFTEIGNTAANVTSYDADDLLTGTKYTFRIRAFDDKGTSDYSLTATATPKAGPPSNSTDLPPVKTTAPDFANGGVGEYETDRWFFDGVSVTSAVDPKVVIPILKNLHVGSVRIWFNKNESWDPVGGDGVPLAKAYKAAGFRVMMVIGDKEVPTYDQAKTFFEYVKSQKNLLKYVDLFEVGNEPNRPTFWKGTPSEYVNIVLKAAWDVLHPAGAKIVGAGPTFDVNFCKTLADAGYLNYVDYANFHPYGSTPEEVYQRAIGAKAAFAGRPILFSEWNIRNTPGKDEWVAKNDATRKLLATVGADSAFYFTLVVANTLAGASGLINIADYSANQPFYDMFKGFGEELITDPLPVT